MDAEGPSQVGKVTPQSRLPTRSGHAGRGFTLLPPAPIPSSQEPARPAASCTKVPSQPLGRAPATCPAHPPPRGTQALRVLDLLSTPRTRLGGRQVARTSGLLCGDGPKGPAPLARLRLSILTVVLLFVKRMGKIKAKPEARLL